MNEPSRRSHPLLRRRDLSPDPFEQFDRWYEEAVREVPLPEAMTLATVTEDGAADARMVLLKGHGPDGFRFHTNHDSAKASQLATESRAALVLYWRELDRQVRIRGPISQLSPADSDAHFAARPRGSRLGIWASPQSQPLPDRDALEAELSRVEARWREDQEIPRPRHWGGYLLRPDAIEFWQGQIGRLHDRFNYVRDPEGAWTIERLAP